MTRPANPAYTIPVHAPDVNYPAGSDNWSGTPTKQTHPGSASVGLTPNTGVPAQVLNRLVFDAYKADGDAKTFITSMLAWTGQMAAQNLGEAGITCTNYGQAKFKNGVWYFSSPNTNDRFARSSYLVAADIGGSEISGGAASTLKHADFDVDNSGNIVVVDDGIDSFKHYNGSTWAKVTGTLGHDTDKANVVYEPVSGLWCIAGVNSGAGAVRVWTSSNRTTWTLRTSPSGMPTGGAVTLGTNGTGRIVMVRHGIAGSLTFAHSDDGGVTWSAASSAATLPFAGQPSGAFYWPKPVWNGSYWLVCASTAAGGGSDGVVYKSTTGAYNTWNLVTTLTNDGIRYIAQLGDLWMGLVDNLRLAMSVDGENWKILPLKVSQCDTIAAGGGRFIMLGVTSDLLHYSHAMGDGSDLLAAT